MSESKEELNSKHTACEDPTDRIERYLKEKRSMRFANIEGISFLRYCIAMIDEDLAIEIVKYGIDVDINEPWDNGQTPLHFACQMDMIELIKAMFEHKSMELNLYAITDDFLVQFNDFQCGGKTVLHYSAMHGALEVCKLLIQFENQVFHANKLLFMTDFEGNTAVDSAIIDRKVHIAKYLMPLQADENCDDKWIQNRTNQLKNKRLQDSKNTRTRFHKHNAEFASPNNKMNQIFTLKRLWSTERSDYILNKVIAFGAVHGWTSKRHRSYSTTDIPSHMIGYELDEYIRELLHDTLYPQMIEKYDLGEHTEIGVRDLFFVQYDLIKQNELKLHRDGSLLSFTILLNDRKEFEGGGTYFEHLKKAISIDKGDCCVFCGKMLHAGHPITKGKRYILVGFLDAKRRKDRQNIATNEYDFHQIQSF